MRVLAAYMDWDTKCTRPTWARIAREAAPPDRPLHRSTVARCLAWLTARGYLGVVESGSAPFLRPGVLHGLADTGEGNRAGVYVLTTRGRASQRRQLHPPHDRGPGENATLSWTRQGPKSPPGAREPAAKVKPGAERAARAQPVLPRAGTDAPDAVPRNRTEALTAARALQERVRALRDLSAEHVRHLARPFWQAGWTPADVRHALDHAPSGRPYGFTAGIRHPAAWARARLAAWRAPDGSVRPSASQIRAAAAATVRAEQTAARAARAAAAARAVDAAASGHGQRARCVLAAASPRAAAALVQAAADARAAARPSAAADPSRPDPGGTSSPAARDASGPGRSGAAGGGGAGLARALLNVRDPAAREAVIAAWRASRARPAAEPAP